jgi:hypothetical protein
VDVKEYEQLAYRAGFTNVRQALLQYQRQQQTVALRQFLAENGIGVYAERRVRRYMHSIMKWSQTFRWQDVSAYEQVIPEPVLMTMAKIREAFPSAIFEVTIVESRHLVDADPFLRVRLQGNPEWFIIERWDEPGFRS